MEGVNRQLDIKAFNFPCGSPCSKIKASYAFFPIRATYSGSRRGLLLVGERGDISSGHLPHTSEVLLGPVLSSQEERENEASNKPESLKSVGGNPSLQDGRPAHSPRPAEARRLAGKGRPEGCLPHYTNTPRPCTNLT